MPVHNADIAAIFEELADLLEIKGENPFRVRAYRNAARTIDDLGTEVRDMLNEGKDLSKLPGIGKDLARQIAEVVDKGEHPKLKALHQELPTHITELLDLPGLGPKRVKALQQTLGVEDLENLEQAAQRGQVQEVEGFGEKTQAQILAAIEELKARQKAKGQRLMLATATHYAEPLLDYLRQVEGVKQTIIAGSYRRAQETVGDLDNLITAKRDSPVMDRFVAYDEVAEVVSHGSTRSTVILHSGLQIDVRVVPEASFGAALHYFTGSKAHNIAVRKLAVQRDLKINEYGIFKGDKRVTGVTEAEVFETVDLPWIPPELREDRGEIEAAQQDALPELIQREDIRGDLHCHTNTTDGRNSLQEMAQAAQARGLEYLAITEHSRRLTVAKGLGPEALREHMTHIDKINQELDGITLLKGIEVDILDDGSLDLPDDVLGELDVVVGAVHSKFDLTEKQQTRRILRAINHPHLTVLAHPSGRLIQQRKAYQVDMGQIIREAAQRGCFLELNAHPQRLDLTDVYCKMAKEAGVLISINSDAHSVLDFDNLQFALGQARRGWLEAQDVATSQPLKKLRTLLKRGS